MIRWIENVSMSDIHLGHHSDLGENTMLIRIQDPATEFKPTKYKFKEVYCFEFLDAEDEDGFDEDFKISLNLEGIDFTYQRTQVMTMVANVRVVYRNLACFNPKGI